MAKRKVSSAAEEVEVQIEDVKAPVANFWEHNHNLIMYGLGAIAVAVGLWFAYTNFYVAPKQKEAVGAMWQAQAKFEQDSFKLALENPGGGYDGFVTLADKFSGTAAGNTANYYAGISYLQLGDFDNAIKYLEDFSPEGDLLPITKYGALGDCYAEKKDMAKAVDFYNKAVKAGDNEVLTAYYLKKLGMANEYNQNIEAAKEAYMRIKKDFPLSQEARDIEKYIYRAGGTN